MALFSNIPVSPSGFAKPSIINFLFVVSFPAFGFGNYISAVKSPSMGYMVSILPHILILIFYSTNILYQRRFHIRVDYTYILMNLFLFSCVLSLFIALNKGLPEASLPLTISKSLLLVVPFHAFVVVLLYNEKKEVLVALMLKSLTLLLLINLVGFYLFGLSNEVHHIEGRINFPFLDGIYSGACLLAIINLLLLHYLKKYQKEPFSLFTVLAYLLINLFLFLLINSRLTILVFVLILLLSAFGLLRIKGLFILSMFTLPLLMASGIIISQIVQWPIFAAILKRVDIEDVATFNGRAFLWRDALDWLTKDQRGLLFGNGYKGHYFLDLVSDVAKLWNEKNLHHMHLHSTSLEILVSQGLVFFCVFAFLLYQIYQYYESKRKAGEKEGAFLPIVVFILFILQVDGFLYFDSIGFVILSLLVANISVQYKKVLFHTPPEAGKDAPLAAITNH